MGDFAVGPLLVLTVQSLGQDIPEKMAASGPRNPSAERTELVQSPSGRAVRDQETEISSPGPGLES